MKSIVSKVTAILSIIIVAISICGISSIDCLRGMFPIQRLVVNDEDVFHGLIYKDISFLQMKRIPFFYIALILIVLSSIIAFTKANKFKSIVNITISLIPAIFILIVHDYLWFLILLNIWLFLCMLIDCRNKDKLSVCAMCFSLIVCFINISKLIQHLNLEYHPDIDIQKFGIELIIISKINLVLLLLWIIPLAVLIAKDVVIMLNSGDKTNE